MTPGSDPHRTLGLNPGATPAEIKRAYRRLAKAYHPDSAGERALPRFLAIQAAYERLTASQPGGTAAGGPGQPTRRGSDPGPAPPPAARPRSADTERARATRDPFRTRSTRSGGDPAGATSGPATGAGPTGRPGPTGRTRPTDASGGAAGGAGGRSPGTGRGSGRRARPKATIGSTSYDGSENEPFEPGWSGATWYGADSGTYWTINPKEYADPRKHGPEYLARARRNLRKEAGLNEPGGTIDPDLEPDGGPDRAPGPAGADPRARGPAAAGPGSPVADGPAGNRANRPPRERPSQAAPATPSAASGLPSPGPAAVPAPSGHGQPVARFSWPDPARVLGSWRGRAVLAALAWLPIGLAIFGIHGQVTGCARFTASCTDPIAWSVWIPQAIAIVLLLASPRLAWIAASGSLVLIALTAPLAAILTVGSGGRPPSPDTTELLIVTMAVGWLCGVGIALSGRVPLPPWRTARVR
jgi:hypothetical protein